MNSKADVIIRFAENDDLDRISTIEKDSIKMPWSKKAIEDFYANPISKILVAIIDNSVCGYITLSCVLDEIQIANVAVSKEHRRKKVASAMISFLLSYARDNSFTNITLEVRESNESAISLYKKFDFENVGIRKNYYRTPCENAILMTHYLLRKEQSE